MPRQKYAKSKSPAYFYPSSKICSIAAFVIKRNYFL